LPTRHPPRATLFPYTTLFRSFDASGSIRPQYASIHAQFVTMSPALQSIRQQALKQRMIEEGITFTLYQSDQTEKALERTIPFDRSEEHTSELQSRENLVCRLL